MSDNLLYHKIYKHPSSTEWVVFIHGAGGNSSIWYKQIKEYRAQFNLLLVDLRGHGRSARSVKQWLTHPYTFNDIAMDVIHVLEYRNIQVAHFVGISLGTIIIRQIAEMAPNLVKSMVLGGAIIRFNARSQVLVALGHVFKHIVPYMWLYRLFAYIIMPSHSQKASRHLFVREAKKLCQKEFKRWFSLTTEVDFLMRLFTERELPIPTLYLMGERDYMFVPAVKELVHKHHMSELYEVPNCGHVVNIERPETFNERSIAFINQW